MEPHKLQLRDEEEEEDVALLRRKSRHFNGTPSAPAPVNNYTNGEANGGTEHASEPENKEVNSDGNEGYDVDAAAVAEENGDEATRLLKNSVYFDGQQAPWTKRPLLSQKERDDLQVVLKLPVDSKNVHSLTDREQLVRLGLSPPIPPEGLFPLHPTKKQFAQLVAKMPLKPFAHDRPGPSQKKRSGSPPTLGPLKRRASGHKEIPVRKPVPDKSTFVQSVDGVTVSKPTGSRSLPASQLPRRFTFDSTSFQSGSTCGDYLHELSQSAARLMPTNVFPENVKLTYFDAIAVGIGTILQATGPLAQGESTNTNLLKEVNHLTSEVDDWKAKHLVCLDNLTETERKMAEMKEQMGRMKADLSEAKKEAAVQHKRANDLGQELRERAGAEQNRIDKAVARFRRGRVYQQAMDCSYINGVNGVRRWFHDRYPEIDQSPIAEELNLIAESIPTADSDPEQFHRLILKDEDYESTLDTTAWEAKQGDSTSSSSDEEGDDEATS